MTIRKAEYRFRNGNVWDILYFKTIADQVLYLNPFANFSRTSGQVFSTNNGKVNFNTSKTYGTSEKIDEINSGGDIVIKKSGRYILIYEINFKTHNSALPNGLQTTLSVGGVNFVTYHGGRWADRVAARNTHALTINLNTIISLRFDCDGGVVDVESCGLTLIYLGA